VRGNSGGLSTLVQCDLMSQLAYVILALQHYSTTCPKAGLDRKHYNDLIKHMQVCVRAGEQDTPIGVCSLVSEIIANNKDSSLFCFVFSHLKQKNFLISLVL